MKKFGPRDWWADFKWLAGIFVSYFTTPGAGRPTSAALDRARDFVVESGHFPPEVVEKIVGKSRFLNHDPEINIKTYSKEKAVKSKLPYSEIQNFIGENKKIEIELTVLPDNFELMPWRDEIANEVAHAAYRENIKTGHVNSNKKLIRVESYKKSKNIFRIHVKLARYEQQAKSNLILDYKHNIRGNIDVSLRDVLNFDFNGKLPPFNDARLANTLGVATVIFFSENGEDIPFLAKRARTTGVFNEAPRLHCTSSFAARWQDMDANFPSSFENMIIRHLKLELLKEAGISDEDVFDLRPLAFCREFMRGGKPQLFFCGKTNLNYEVLAYNFTAARNLIISNKERPESTEISFVRPKLEINSPSDIFNYLANQSITTEAAAALYYSFLDRSSEFSHN